VLAMAIRIARAASGRQRIAFCGYHGWHDWYLSTNLAAENALSGHLLAGLAPAGVPVGLTGTTLPFRYNHIEELRKIVAEHGRELAAIVMEPIRDVDPAPGFLEEVRALATRTGAALIFDEVSCAWRTNTGGMHLVYGVNPDLAAFAKAMSNGYAMAALIGTRAVMDAAQQTFISSTYWTERIGPTAALATIRKHRREVVPKHLAGIGTQVRAIWREAAGAAGLAIAIGGLLPASTFALQYPDAEALATLFVQEMLDRGFLATTKFNAMFAHRAAHLEQYRTAVNQVFPLLAEAVAHGDVMARLRGPVKHSDFQRLT
jgi:glutamate-1-semialdehyde aminotransferase